MRSFLRGTILSVSLLLAPAAEAWVFDEHEYLGAAAYNAACSSIVGDLAAAIKAREDSNGTTDPALPALKARLMAAKAVPCKNLPADAYAYGTWSALSGDHVSSPDKLLSVEGEIDALSLQNYGLLALDNHNHFWPVVRQTWERYHAEAITLAREAHQLWQEGRVPEAAQRFRTAATRAAFADHFLQDAFSIGHMGFSRINSQQNASLKFHDFWNARGRKLNGLSIPSDAYSPLKSAAEKLTLLTAPSKPCIALEPFAKTVDAESRSLDHCGMPWKASGTVMPAPDRCHNVGWDAYGDRKLFEPANAQNKCRAVWTNASSISAIILTFVDGSDNGNSLVAGRSFPVETQSIEPAKGYGFLAYGFPDENFQRKLKDDCDTAEELVNPANRRNCWFGVETTYAEPTYPLHELSATYTGFPEQGSSFFGIRGATAAYSEVIQRSDKLRKTLGLVLTRNSRVYGFSSLTSPHLNFGGQEIDHYTEIGLSYSLPNFYHGTVFSHDLDIGMGKLWQTSNNLLGNPQRDYERGPYVGLNTSVDAMGWKFSAGVGSFFPHANTDSAELKAQLTIGYNFGATGGGAIKRWRENQ